MSYTIERLTHYPTILVTLNDDFKIPEEFVAYAAETQELLDREPERVFIITDMTNFNVSVNDLLQGTKLALNPQINVAKHPKTRGSILITNAGIIKKSVDGLRKLGIAEDLKVVTSLEEALELCSAPR